MVAVTSFTDYDDAINIANDTLYGLVSYGNKDSEPARLDCQRNHDHVALFKTAVVAVASA